MARPKKYDINPDKVEQLASFGCNNKEIAEFYGCSRHLIEKSYSHNLTKGRASGKTRLRELQWAVAEKGNLFSAPDTYMEKIAVGSNLPNNLLD